MGGSPTEAAFHERAIATIVDHGIGLPIFPAHLLKTWSSVWVKLRLDYPPARVPRCWLR